MDSEMNSALHVISSIVTLRTVKSSLSEIQHPLVDIHHPQLHTRHCYDIVIVRYFTTFCITFEVFVHLAL